jgi:hypothetical protein
MTEKEFTLLDKRFDTVERLLNGVNTRLDSLNGKVYAHENQIQEALGERKLNREKQKEVADKVEELEVRTNLLEKTEITHVINCPQAPKIRVLEDNQLTSKAIKKWIVASIAVTGTVMSILWIIIKLYLDTHGL